MSIILALESSCDETSASIIKGGNILANVIATQEVHSKYGGVIPELASRAHQQNIVPVISQALTEAKIHKSELNAVAFTRGPGLLGALLVGVSFAKAYAYSLGIPLIEVNHMQAHILAHFIDTPRPNFPFLCLTVSGGHTQIVEVVSPLEMKIIGQTMDDAVGEAFDKTAKLIGLPYPGGPLIDKYAKQGNSERFQFPIGEMKNYDYSFSGIKTAILYFLKARLKEDEHFIENNLVDICASVQKALIEILMKKFIKAARDRGIDQLAIAGGVAANSGLRDKVQEEANKRGWEVFIPKFEYCTDNAAMIAMAAHFKYEKKLFVDYHVVPDPRLSF